LWLLLITFRMSFKSLRESLDSDNYKNIRRKLIILREKNSLTQRELAKKLSTTQSYVSKVESGQRRLDILELKKYLKVLNYPINQLINYWKV
jgi:transcriptional regulator with XRE-family HTH domain